MSKDTIYRQAAINTVEKHYRAFDNDLLELIAFELKALPSARSETAKRIVVKSRNGITLWYQCDICNEPVDAQDNYCSGCGRRLNE